MAPKLGFAIDLEMEDVVGSFSWKVTWMRWIDYCVALRQKTKGGRLDFAKLKESDLVIGGISWGTDVK